MIAIVSLVPLRHPYQHRKSCLRQQAICSMWVPLSDVLRREKYFARPHLADATSQDRSVRDWKDEYVVTGSL
jgi:hypothetical protein